MKVPIISLHVDDVHIAPLRAEDAAEVAAITDASVTRRIDFLPAEFGLRDAEALIANMDAQNVHHGVRRARDGALLGVIGVHVRHSADGPAFETGYWFAAHARGRGLAGRSMAAVVRHLVGVAAGCAVVAECAPSNARSWALLRRIGFESKGVNGRRVGRRLLQWGAVAGQRIDVC